MNGHKLVARGFFVALALAAWTAPGAESQTTLGVRGGVSVTSVSLDIDETFDESNRTGFAGGVFLDIGGSSPLGIQVGAQYTQKGTELDFGDAVEEFSLDYLEIPVVLKLGIPLGPVKPSVFGGAALGFNTSCEADDDEVCDELSSQDWSGVFGADLAVYLGGVSLWVDGRYHVGLSDISGDLEFVEDLKNQLLALALPTGSGLIGALSRTTQRTRVGHAPLDPAGPAKPVAVAPVDAPLPASASDQDGPLPGRAASLADLSCAHRRRARTPRWPTSVGGARVQGLPDLRHSGSRVRTRALSELRRGAADPA
jgi:hypothetical protein